MTETINLALDTGEEGGRRVARVYLELASSYLKGQGAPTLTADCGSYVDLEREITRLKDECDVLLEEGREAFGVESSVGAGAGAAAEPAEALPPSRNLPVRMGADLRVRDEMTADVKTMLRNDKLSVADELMKVGGFRHVVVIDDDSEAVVGIVSHRDIFYGALAWSTGQGERAHQKALAAIAVKAIMRSDVTTVAPDTPLAEAARTILEKKIGCLPVVHNERLVGILTEGDFLAAILRSQS